MGVCGVVERERGGGRPSALAAACRRGSSERGGRSAPSAAGGMDDSVSGAAGTLLQPHAPSGGRDGEGGDRGK